MKSLSDVDINQIKKTFPKRVGYCIKTIRLKKGITQTEIGNATGKDRQYIYKIEKGKVTINISTLLIICSALEIKLYDFFIEMDTIQ